MSPSKPFTVLIAASGTGGHLFPAIFIGLAFQSEVPGSTIHFLGSGRPLEAELLAPYNFGRHAVKIVGLKSRGLKGLIEFLSLLPAAATQVWKLLSQQKPDVVIGVGGYATFLPIVLARLRGIPTWIHEAERKPGVANYVLSFIASRISVAFEDARIPNAHKKVFTGQPVKPELRTLGQEPFTIDRPKHLLIMGGSQGAKALDDASKTLAPWCKANDIEVWHQARPENVADVRAAYEQAGVKAKVVEFIQDTVSAYRWAHVILCRAGAGTVMELGVINKPCVLVPYPFAQGNHQLANAKVLADNGKAEIVEEGAGFQERLSQSVAKLFEPNNYLQMRARPLVARNVDAAEQIVRGSLKLRDRAVTGRSATH